MRVSFVHTKGGVGKTTSAMLVAIAAAKAGRPVEVYDTDKQGSARRWAEIAQQRDDKLPFPVISLTAPQLRDLPPSNETLQIIDTPPGEAASIQAAIDTADLIIVPTGAAPMDIDRVWPTLDAVEGHPVGVLLTGVLMHTRFYRSRPPSEPPRHASTDTTTCIGKLSTLRSCKNDDQATQHR